MKKRLIFLGIFALLTLCTIILDTYGLFETNSTGTSEFEIGRWIILLNNIDVNINRTITLNDFTYTGNEHIENGYFAPGSVGTLELTIDATNTDVAFEYSIEFDTSQLEEHPNILLTITNTQTNEIIQDDEYTGTIYMNDNRELSLNISLTWNNVDTYNESDSALIDNPISIPVEFSFRQIIEE